MTLDMMDRVVSSPFNYSYPNSVLELATRVLTLTPFIKQFVDEKEPVRGTPGVGVLWWVNPRLGGGGGVKSTPVRFFAYS